MLSKKNSAKANDIFAVCPIKKWYEFFICWYILLIIKDGYYNMGLLELYGNNFNHTTNSNHEAKVVLIKSVKKHYLGELTK